MNGNTSSQPLSDEARHLGLVPLFRRLDERELVKLAEEVDQASFKAGERLNLMLSMTAAMQSPVILMSQTAQASEIASPLNRISKST